MPDTSEGAVQRGVDFHLGDDGGLHLDERNRLPVGEVAGPCGRQWAWPGVAGAGPAERQTAQGLGQIVSVFGLYRVGLSDETESSVGVEAAEQQRDRPVEGTGHSADDELGGVTGVLVKG